MTSTEDRLTDALRASADFVSQESLRQLVSPEIERARPVGRIWLAALVPAAAVLLVVGGVAAIGNRSPAPRPRPASAPAVLPRYLVEVGDDHDVVVRSTATGKITSSFTGATGATELTATVVAGASRAPLFAVAYDVGREWTEIAEFGLTDTGKIAHFRPVREAFRLRDVTLAVSPDGSKIAIAGVPRNGPGAGHEILEAIDAKTGAASIWSGGTTQRHRELVIPSLSWPAGRSLIYLAWWCLPGGTGLFDGDCQGPAGKASAEPVDVMQLPVLGKQGLLPGGKIGGKFLVRFLASGRPEPVQVVSDPADANVAFFVTQLRDRLLIVRERTHGYHRYAATVFQTPREPVFAREISASFAADPSGSYLLVNVNRGAFYGWVHAGKFHRLDAKTVDWQSGAW